MAPPYVSIHPPGAYFRVWYNVMWPFDNITGDEECCQRTSGLHRGSGFNMTRNVSPSLEAVRRSYIPVFIESIPYVCCAFCNIIARQ